MKQLKSECVRIYILAVFMVIPLYYENGYFNTLVAKYHIYTTCVMITLSAALILWVVGKCMEKPLTFAPLDYFKDFTLLDIAVAAFGIVAALSCVFSSYGRAAWTGENGWRMGGTTLITLVLVYFYISRNYIHTKRLWLGFLLVADALYFLAFLNGLDIDPLGLHTLLTEKEHFEYIATVGNVNSYAGYLSMSVPLLAMLYVGNKRKWFTIAAGISLVFAYTNLYMANSDGAFLGVGFAFIFFIYYCLKDVKRYRGLLWNGIFFTIASIIVKLATLLRDGDMIEFLGVPATMLKYYLYLPIGLVCLVLLIFVPKMEAGMSEKSQKYLSRTFMIVTMIALGIMVAYNISIFSGRWGSKRGWIWMFSMKLFGDGSIKDKLIGVGPDSFAIPMMSSYGEFIQEKWGKRVANAHNEYIQYLITTGILGALSYLGLYIGAFREYIKKVDWTEEKAAVFFAIMGYAGQSFVNNPQAMNYAFFFVMMAMLRGMREEEEKMEPIGKKAKSQARKNGKKRR